MSYQGRLNDTIHEAAGRAPPPPGWASWDCASCGHERLAHNRITTRTIQGRLDRGMKITYFRACKQCRQCLDFVIDKGGAT